MKLAVTTAAAGLAPSSQSDWGPATTAVAGGSDDQLLPNSYATGDGPDTYLITIASNLAAGPGAPIVVLGGFPVDRELLAWTIMSNGDATYAVGAARTLSSAFGGGTGARVDASLAVARAPDGGVDIVYTDDAKGAAPGVHVARVDAAGAVTADAVVQPTTAQVRHAMIAADAASRPVVMYVDGNQLVGTLRFGGAWLAPVTLAAVPAVAGAWPVSDPWQPAGVETFGAYVDGGAGVATTFASVSWR